MKVRVISDLHLEFDDEDKQFTPGTGDVLVLAGDVCLVNEYEKYHRFFELCANGYNQVFYVIGNHEHYEGTFEETFYKLQEKLPEGVTLLNNKSIFYRGVHFVGGTLWTNQNSLDFETMKQSQDCMNDYRWIHKRDGSTLNVLDTIDEHMFTRGWFEQAIPTLRGPVFMVTHHGPFPQSVKGRYVNNGGAYASDMTELVEKNPHITHWAHGHIHENNDYKIGNCRVISNPRGYNGLEMNPNFNPCMEIEV